MKNYQRKYIVWVGATGNVFDDVRDAEQHVMNWIDDGYDDVVIEVFKERIS